MADKTTTIVEIELLLRNGREVFLTLELPRDTDRDDGNGYVTYARHLDDGITEEHILQKSEVAYMRRRTVVEAQHEHPPMRTLREPAAQSR